MLTVFDALHSSNLPYLFAVFFGIGYAAAAALPPLITVDFFEGEGYGRVFGGIMLLNGLGGAFGAWISGFLFDQTRNYLPVSVVLMACSSFSCLSIWWAALREVRRVPEKVRSVQH